MAYESSEIMTAAALTYDNSKLNEASKSYEGLVTLMLDIKNKIQQNKMLEYGSGSIKKGFTDLIDEKDSKKIKDLAIGISAAKGIRDYVGKTDVPMGQRIYLTGNVLPDDVKKFQVSAFGMKDYNSADLIYTRDKKVFYGLSLKKKNKPTAPSPTLINKAFDSILIGREFDKIKKELIDIRIKYFSDIVIEAVEKDIIREDDIKNFKQLKNSNRKELFEAKARDKNKFDRAYIDTKGYYKAENRYKNSNTNDMNSMRYFVNRKLAEKDNALYTAFIKVMDDNAQLFADTLITLILKTKLYDKMDAETMKKFAFDFSLITGIGDANEKRNSVSIFKASTLPLQTTLCGLTRLERMFGDKKYEIKIDKAASAKSKGAKVFLKLTRGNVTLLDLQIRYKGAFTPQPQFQATLNNQFKKLLEQECGVPGV